MALKRAMRLRKSSDFQRVRQEGRSLSSRLLILGWRPNDVTQLRIGFVVSKRISKRAVERNYLKRLLGEAVRISLPGLPPGIDIVFSARNAASTATVQMLENDIQALLQRAKLVTVAPNTTNKTP